MVILVRSLRAVLRKDSWMFCAGLFSIADLLGPDHLVPPLSSDRSGSELRSLLALGLIVRSGERNNPPDMRSPETLYASAQRYLCAMCTIRRCLPHFKPGAVPGSGPVLKSLRQ